MGNKVYLKDYKEVDFFITEVNLEVEIKNDVTVVKNESRFIKNKNNDGREVILNGIDLKLKEIEYDGNLLEYRFNSENDIIFKSDLDEFILKTIVEIHPEINHSLEGLYVSDGIYTTQNEPEGFRRITYHSDRPDVMSQYTTKIIADKKKYPFLLSNGNLIEESDLGDGRHYAIWNDPFNKPSYLFAIVAGDLSKISSDYTTMSGREVTLDFFVDKGNEHRVAHAMKSLKQSMKWDEEVFGLEYDLDRFMVVAIDAFNMGAMENKSLNIFNSQLVLSNRESSTDGDFKRIRDVIGHEYFHNWTGNRVTCKNWFHLSLKEGLTVFREQEFAGDMTNKFIQRIDDVRIIKGLQFLEARGPMSHPVMPKEYMEINNFYTVTVYEKGAELIRMIYTYIGQKAFRDGMDIYFKNHDGHAVTIEEFILSMEESSGIDLKQFRRWYDQKRTPYVSVVENYDADSKQLLIDCEQHLGEYANEPFEVLQMPIKISLYDQNGHQLETKYNGNTNKEHFLDFNTKKKTFIIEDIEAKPVSSILREFSAPVILEDNKTVEELLFLYQYDNDGYVRYESGQKIHIKAIEEIFEGGGTSLIKTVSEVYKHLLQDISIDMDFMAILISIPSLSRIAQEINNRDYIKLGGAHRKYVRELSSLLEKEFCDKYDEVFGDEGEETISIQKRRLQTALLTYLIHTSKGKELCVDQYQKLNAMDYKLSAMNNLASLKDGWREEIFKHFYQRWEKDSLVITKYFQAIASGYVDVDLIDSLRNDRAFDIKTPNKVRALFGTYINNLEYFHGEYKKSYSYMADVIIELDKLNPSVSSALMKAFSEYKKLPDSLRGKMKIALDMINKKAKSKNVLEQVSAILG